MISEIILADTPPTPTPAPTPPLSLIGVDWDWEGGDVEEAGSVQAGVGEEWGRGRVISLPQSLLQQLILTSKMLWSPNIIPF